MKQAKFLLLTLLAVLGYSEARADYTVNFNTEIATSSSDFKVASNWQHIVDVDTYYDNNMSYSWKESDGIDSSGALLAMKQMKNDWGSSGTETYDMLVTPVVSGTVTIYAYPYSASSSNKAFVELYSLNSAGTARDTKLTSQEWTSTTGAEWTAVTIEVSEPQRIGIRAQYVYLDNFSATTADIVAESSLSVTKVMDENGNEKYQGTYPIFYQQPDGNMLVKLKVALLNNGDVDFVAGSTENYTITLAKGTSSAADTYYDDATVAITEDLAAGESKTIDVSFTVPYVSGYSYWYVRENVTGTTSSSFRYANSAAYEPKFLFREAGSTSTSSLTNAAWGTISESTTKNYEIYNDGTAPLIVNSITLPDGFTSTAIDGGTSVKLIHSGFDDAGAVFYAWTWIDGQDGRWVAGNDDVYEGLDNNVIFVRMNPNGAPSWDAKWNQTGNLTLQGGGYVLDSYNGDEMVGHWVAAIVDAKSSKAIDITQDAAQTGTFSGDVVVKYMDASSTEKTHTMSISTTVIGAGTWFAEFNSSTSGSVTFPEGSLAENGVRQGTTYVSSGNYDGYLYSYTSSSYATVNNKFITPKLHANAGDQLTFDVAREAGSSSSYNLKVYVSTDRQTWGEPVYSVTAADLTTAYQNQAITFDTEGDYYVAFAIYGVKIDNLVGLQKVDVTHDLYIKEVTWQDAEVNSGAEISSKPKVTIIPLTNETADAYTVKYIYGDNEVVGTPVALTASATSTKDFTFTFTPEVESTTTFEGTKVVFEFTDGTKFESETFDFTVKNEPKFHFVKTLPTSKWSEPSDYTTPIAFGKTNQEDAQTYYLVNWGSAPLNVKSISLPEGYTVSVETPLTVGAFDGTNEGIAAASQSFDIIFSATETGTYSGDMVITYVNGAGEDATFTIAVSGTKLDPNKWYANFDDNKWPAGSTYQNNVSMTNGGTYSAPNYYISSSSTTNNLFITPKLTATAGEKIQFDAKYYNSYNTSGKVVVYAAATRDALTDTEVEKTPIFTTEGMTTDYQTFEVTIPEAGDYYLAFEITGRPYVDEIYGLTRADVDYDLALGTTNIPTEAMQNVTATATVNVKNYGLAAVAAEDYQIMVGIGDIKSTAEQGTVELPMTPALSAAGTAISVSFLSPKAGTYPVTIAITDNEGNILTKTEPVNVTFAEEEASSEIVVGTQRSGSASRDYAIIDFYNLDNYALTSDILYTAAQLEEFGVIAGTKITAITFKGTISSAKTISNSLTAWVGTSTGEITYNSPDKSAMQEVTIYDGTMAFVSGENDIVVTLPQPIVYDGSSDLRVYFEGTKGGWASLSFNYDSKYSNMKWSNASSMKYNPLAYLSIEATIPTIAGTVTDADNQPIANATVTLVSADSDQVQYEGTTDDDGNYSISVIQSTRTYDATVSAEGYDDEVAEDVSFAEAVNGVLTKDFTLTQTPEFVEVTIGVRGAASFSSKYPLDFSSTDVTAYIITGKEGTIFTRQAVTEVPANTGILVYAAQGTYQIPVAANEPEDIDNNLLVATSKGEYTVTEEDYGRVYGLFYSTKQQKMGFQKKSVGYTFGVDKCYLLLPEGANANELFFDLDTLTGIDAIATDAADEKGDTFNLSGQKVNASYKGVIIRNGKKMIQK